MVFQGNSALAYATAHTLTVTGNTVDISSKDHGYWGASEIGNITWEVTTENLYTKEGYDALFAALVAKTPIDIVFGEAANYDANGLSGVGTGSVQSWTKPTTGAYAGKAVITSLVANANTGENATYSATFTGYGALTLQTA